MQALFDCKQLPASVVYNIIQYVPCHGVDSCGLQQVRLQSTEAREERQGIMETIHILNKFFYRHFKVYVPLKDSRLHTTAEYLYLWYKKGWSHMCRQHVTMYHLDTYGLQLTLYRNMATVTYRAQTFWQKRVQISCDNLFKYERSKSGVRVRGQAPV